MFGQDVTRALVAAAKANGIRPAALLALVEVETSGKVFEQDGKTPQLLLERHKIYSEAGKVSNTKQAAFVRAGLAHPDWRRSTQYQDQRTSAQRLELVAKACAIDEEITKRACSWGIGQTMGFLYGDLKFPSAVAMVAHQTGSLEGQIDCMIREIKHSHLVEPMNQGDYAHVARIYNGSGYAANHYDTRLADADKRWTRRLETSPPDAPPPPEASLSRDEVRLIQQALSDMGYAEVGQPDGSWGSRTTGAVSAFQQHEGLPVTGHWDAATKDAMRTAHDRPVSMERAETAVSDLRDAGSETVVAADKISFWGKIKMWAGGATVAGGAGSSFLDTAQEAADKAGQAKGLLGTVKDFIPVALLQPSNLVVIAGVALLVVGIVVMIHAASVKRQRLADHRDGSNSMPTGG